EYELQEQFDDEETGTLKQEIGSEALNKWLFNTDTVNKVLMHLMENGLKVEGGDKLGKTIIFAKNRKHAEFIVEQFDKNYPHLAGKFCRKVDYSVKYAQSLIDDFSIKEKDPYIAVSVDMLDTGIDIPEVVNLVFFKLVRSKTKFWQMVGRGTRLCQNLFGPGQDKQEFYIFDYCQNLDFFDANPEGYDAKAQESVKQKIFKRRLDLTAAFQQGQPEDKALKVFAEQLKDQMHGVVRAMNIDNFIIRKHREHVEFFNDRANWVQLTDAQINIINERLSGLPSRDDDNEDARRFDLLILNLQVALLQHHRTFERYQFAVKEIARNLEEKSAIPQVAAQMELILEIQTDEYWKDITLPMLEELRRKLRDLIRFAEAYAKEDVYTDFEDTLIEGDTKEYQIIESDPKLKDYYSSVKRFIREHQDHITIRRLKNNEQISEQDIKALEDILFSEEGPIPREEYEKIYGETPLGYLVRSMIGLNRSAAKKVFAEFMEKAPLHPEQISFLDEVIEYLVHNGVMEPRIMFEIPFIHFHDKGVVGMFGERSAEEIVDLVECVNENAKVA
ncbi:MAG: restriction endonuclease subunit R, partial [Proteobacteria bacterium]|nr:restriction endonuclease subunit R [Pseudomonadota bacterium]